MIRLSHGLTFQDWGRRSHRHRGIPVSGPLDRDSFALAYFLVSSSGPGVEILYPGTCTIDEPCVFALAGQGFTATFEGSELPFARAISFPGGVIEFRPAKSGVASYLCFARGLVAKEELGSESAFSTPGFSLSAVLEAELGSPCALEEEIKATLRSADTFSYASWTLNWLPQNTGRPIRVIPGPEDRDDTYREWKVEMSYLRAGLRFAASGPVQSALAFPSAATLPGLLQGTPDGGLYLFQVDSPTVGGYPRVGVVASADLSRTAQVRSGEAIQLAICTVEEAHEALEERGKIFKAASQAVHTRLRLSR